MADQMQAGTVELDDGRERKVDMAAGRRAFMRAAGLSAAAAATLAIPGTSPAQAAPNVDIQILNFALNLEYLEAEFYLQAAFGRGLAAADVTGNPAYGAQGTVTGGRKVMFTEQLVADYANEIASDEEAHVKFLRSALGDSKIARPAINIQGAFKTAARAAGLIGPNDPFDAYDSDKNFLLAAYIFEDVGVSAYHGAAGLITDKGILGAAAGILAVEAYHAGLIRTVLFAKGFFKETKLISRLRNQLDGTMMGDQGVGPGESSNNGGPATLSNIVLTDSNGLALSRTSRQVLNIAYGAINATSGLFFPAGGNPGPS